MRVTVRIFGPEEKRMGRSSVSVELPAGATANQLLSSLNSRYPRLANAGMRLALNHAFAKGSEIIRADDELALIGMVGGG